MLKPNFRFSIFDINPSKRFYFSFHSCLDSCHRSAVIINLLYNLLLYPNAYYYTYLESGIDMYQMRYTYTYIKCDGFFEPLIVFVFIISHENIIILSVSIIHLENTKLNNNIISLIKEYFRDYKTRLTYNLMHINCVSLWRTCRYV